MLNLEKDLKEKRNLPLSCMHRTKIKKMHQRVNYAEDTD